VALLGDSLASFLHYFNGYCNILAGLDDLLGWLGEWIQMELAGSEAEMLFRVLGNDLRWRITRTLARGDFRVQELSEALGRPVNLLSYHLGELRRARLVRERRGDADARDVYYGLDLERLRALYRQLGEEIHPAMVQCFEGETESVRGDDDRPVRVLFLCTENSARSQMAEGILRHLSHGRVDVASAGSRPTGVHPLAVRVLAERGIDISANRSKSVREFMGQRFDYVITVCDRIKEECPTFPGDPQRIHWSFADPAMVVGSEEHRYWAFQVTAKELTTMIQYLLIMIEKEKGVVLTRPGRQG